MAILMQVERDLAMMEEIFADKKIAKCVAKYLTNPQNLTRIFELNCLDFTNKRVEFEVALQGGIRAIEQSYALQNNGVFEAHRKYVDFQFVARGSEIMKVGFADAFAPINEYCAIKDCQNFTPIKSPSSIALYENSLLILTPNDIHAGGFEADSKVVFKSVLKVPFELLKL